MATIIWDMPSITPTSAGNISEFSVAINDLNDKLLSVGLINYSGENEAALSGIINYVFPTITAAGYQSFFLCKLKYKMPIGNGDDIPWKIPDTTSLEFNKCTPLWILIFTIIINKLKV